MEMRCYHKILCILYKDRVINEEVCAKIQQAVVPHKDLTIIKRHKLHGMNMSPVDQVWPILSCKAQWQGEEDKAEGKRDGKTIREWTGLEFARSQRAKENREKWRKLVVKSSVVPQ